MHGFQLSGQLAELLEDLRAGEHLCIRRGRQWAARAGAACLP